MAPDEDQTCAAPAFDGWLPRLPSAPAAPAAPMGPPAPGAGDGGAAQEAAAREAAAQEAAAAEAAAREEAERRQLAADRALAQSVFAELDDAMGIGMFDLADAGSAQQLLAGRTPQQMEQIRAYYAQQTGRRLESDIAGQFGGTEQNEMMASVLSGMSLHDRIDHYETSGQMENLLDAATPEEIAELTRGGEDDSILATLRDKMSPQDFMEARSRLFPDQAVAAVAERIEAAEGIFNDDEGGAMTAFATLSITQRQEFLAQHRDSLSFLSSAEMRRFEDMAVSESAALEARLTQATNGLGTDDDSLGAIAADAGRLMAEETRLRESLANADLPEAERAQIETRLAEMGDVHAMLAPQRNADGSLVEGSFMDRLEGDVGDGQLHSLMAQMGLSESEVAKQTILDAVGFFNDDERGMQEAFANVPIEQRMALWEDPQIQAAINGSLSDAERELLQAFRDNDVRTMSETRIEEGNGFFAQDEAQILGSVMDMSAEDREAFRQTPLYLETYVRMTPEERVALDEAMENGQISLETGISAASGGSWDGTNDELMTLVSERKSAEDTLAIRRGYVLAQEGIEPSTPEEVAALALYRQTSTMMESELGGDDYQTQMDQLLAHQGSRTDLYTGETTEGTSAAIERSTGEGRMTASLLMDARADEKMGEDGDGGGGLASWFSDTDETAIQAHQAQKSAHYEAIADGAVTEDELAGHEALSQAFGDDFEAMVAAQNAITDAVATGVSVVAAIAITLATSGAAGPAVAAFMAQYGFAATAVTMAATQIGTKELMGGDRYDATGEDGFQDAGMAIVDAATARATGALGDMVQGRLAARFPGVFMAGVDDLTGAAVRQSTAQTIRDQLPGVVAKNLTDNLASGVIGSTVENLTDKDFYEQTLGGMLGELGTDAVNSAPGALRDALIGTLVDSGVVGWQSNRLQGFMDGLEARGIPAAEIDGMSVGTINELGRVQKALDAGNSAEAAAMLQNIEGLTDQQRAAMAATMQETPAVDVAAPEVTVADPFADVATVEAVATPEAAIETPEGELTPEIQAALDPNRVDVEVESIHDPHAGRPELSPEVRLENATTRAQRAIEIDPDRAMSGTLQELIDAGDVEGLESILNHHGWHHSEAALAHLKPLGEAGVPGAYLDVLTSDQLVAVGRANEAMAAGSMDDALDSLEGAGLEDNVRNMMLAKILETHQGAAALADRPDLQVLSRMADIQNPNFRADDATLLEAIEVMGSSESILAEWQAVEKFPADMRAGLTDMDPQTRVKTIAEYMRSQLPDDHHALDLHDAELVGQFTYTTNVYDEFSSPLRDIDPEAAAKMMPVIEAATSGVNRLPQFDGPVRRRTSGHDFAVDNYHLGGGVVPDLGYSSGSLASDLDHFGTDYIIDIDNATGAEVQDISAYGPIFGNANEYEILGHPGKRLEFYEHIVDGDSNWLRAREVRNY